MALVELVDRQVDPAGRAVYLSDGRRLKLSSKEAELLSFLVARAGEPVSWTELLAEVWGYHDQVVSRAPYHTWRRLVAKLEADASDPRHCLSVHGVGVRFQPLPPRRDPAPAAQLAPFVGRAAELRHLEQTVAPGRAVSLLGPGGVGKTRLASAFAERAADRWEEIVTVGLAEACSADDLLRATGRALQIRAVGSRDAVGAIGVALGARGRLLLVLDNLEQVRDAGPILSAWLAAAPNAALLLTSRAAVGVEGERTVEVAPLPLQDAVELFLACARSVGPEVAAAARPELQAVVDLLDRLPLAIELAAARSRVLAPSQLLERLERRFEILRRVPGAQGEARHAALWSTLAWSWELLDPAEQSALVQLSVFRGGFDLAAAEAVVDLSGIARAPSVLDALDALIQQHLVVPGPERFDLLVSIREFAAAMGDRGVLAGAVARHGRWYAGFAASEEAEILRGEVARFARLLRDLDNLIAAAERTDEPSVAAGAGSAAVNLLAEVGPLDAAVDLCDRLLALPGHADADRVRLLLARGRALLRVDRLRAVEDYEAASALTRASGPHGASAALGLGTCLPPAQGVVVLRRALSLYEAQRDRLGQARTLRSLALALMRSGDLDGAAAAGADAVQLYRILDNDPGLVEALEGLGTIAQQSGDFEGAESLFAEGLTIARRCASRRLVSLCLGGLAVVAAELGELERAEALIEETAEVQATIGARDLFASSLGALGQIRLMRGRLPEARTALVRALDLAAEVGLQRLSMYEAVLAVVEARDRRLSEARRRVARAREAMQGDRSVARVEVLLMEAEVALRCGETDLVAQRLAEAEAMAEALGVRPRFREAIDALARGDPATEPTRRV